MLKSTALVNFARSNDSSLHTRAVTVVSAITGNSNFSDTGSMLTDLAAASDAYTQALAVAKVGTPSQIAEKNERKKELVAALKAMCDYVNYVAGGNRAILLTSGYELSKETRTNVVIEPIKELTFTYGKNSGSVQLSVKKGKGVRSVMFQHSLDETSSNTQMTWITSSCTENNCTISNLPVGKMVWLRAGVVGPRRQLLYTEPVQKMVV